MATVRPQGSVVESVSGRFSSRAGFNFGMLRLRGGELEPNPGNSSVMLKRIGFAVERHLPALFHAFEVRIRLPNISSRRFWENKQR